MKLHPRTLSAVSGERSSWSCTTVSLVTLGWLGSTSTVQVTRLSGSAASPGSYRLRQVWHSTFGGSYCRISLSPQSWPSGPYERNGDPTSQLVSAREPWKYC